MPTALDYGQRSPRKLLALYAGFSSGFDVFNQCERCNASSVSVRTPLRCAECGREAHEAADGWRAYLWESETSDDREVTVFCPECASREFEGDVHD